MTLETKTTIEEIAKELNVNIDGLTERESLYAIFIALKKLKARLHAILGLPLP